MAGLGIDINEIIKSAYETVKEIQQSATETVGTDCLWARATPVINSEDVVLQEYTSSIHKPIWNVCKSKMSKNS